jgi:hypothetical protein
MDGEQISDGDMEADETVEPTKVAGQEMAQLSHGEDLSDVSDLDSTEEEAFPMPVLEQQQQKQHRPDGKPKGPGTAMENGPSNARGGTLDNKSDEEAKRNGVAATVGGNTSTLNDEPEQLDFEADGQWKDVKEDGEAEQHKEQQLPKEAKKNDAEAVEAAKPKEQINKDKGKDKSKDKAKVRRVTPLLLPLIYYPDFFTLSRRIKRDIDRLNSPYDFFRSR